MVIKKYKKQFLAYINKEGFDHSKELISPMEYHTSFVTFAELFAIMDYEKKPFWMYISPICTFCTSSTAATLFLISAIEFLRKFNIHLLTESGSYFLIMMYKLLVVSSITGGKKHYHNLLLALRDDFHYICTTGQKYREKFFENQRATFKACVIVGIFTFFSGGGIAAWAWIKLAAYLIRKQEGAQRPLPYPFWLFDYNLNESPLYEILFAASMLFTFFNAYLFIFMMKSEILWVREITCKADIITWSLQDLLVDVSPARNNEEKEYYAALIKKRMRVIVEMHLSMFKLMEGYAAVFKKCLLYEQMIGSPIICMCSYTFAERFDEGDIQVILILLCGAVIMVVLVPSYLCSHLLEKVQSVSDACWDVPFWNCGTVIRPYLVIIMQRSLRKLPLAAPGFADISLQTFTTMMTRAYSCFNMLRQADFNFT